MAACLTHDVDAVRRGKLPRGVAAGDVKNLVLALARGRVGTAVYTAAQIVGTARGPNPYWTFDRILAMEGRHGYRSTYFVMAGRRHREDAAYDPGSRGMRKLMGALRDSGAEVGLHGSYGSYMDGVGLLAQRKRMEELTESSVTGHRNHLLRFRAPESWRAHEVAGFSYDSTLGFVDHEGFRSGHAFPFHPYDVAEERRLGLLELPLAVMDVTLIKHRRLGIREAGEAIERVMLEAREAGGLVNLLWHNDTLYEAEYPGSVDLYRLALARLAEFEAHVAPCGEINQWWRARSAVKISTMDREPRSWEIETPLELEGLVLRASLPTGMSHRVDGEVPVREWRDGADTLLEFGRLPAHYKFRVILG